MKICGATIACCFLAAVAAAQARPEVTTLSGVVRTVDAQPIRHAILTLRASSRAPDAARSGATGPIWPRTTVSDGDGRFVFPDLDPGTYILAAKRPPYVDAEYGATRPGGSGTPVVVESRQPTPELVITMVKGSVIAGIVHDVDGRPATDISVSIDAAPSRTTGPISTVTDERGAYRFFGLSPGEYVIKADVGALASVPAFVMFSSSSVDAMLSRLAQGRRGADVGASGPASAPQPDHHYAPTFYPGTANPGQALPIVVTAGEVREGVDFDVLLTGTTTISGTVVGLDGQPAPGVSVSAVAEPRIQVFSKTVTTSDGRFYIRNITPGPWLLAARMLSFGSATSASLPSARSPKPRLWAKTEVVASDSVVTDVTLRLQASLRFSGRVAFHSASVATPAPTKVRVTLASVATDVRDDGPVLRSEADARLDGTFDVSDLMPGAYQVSAVVPGDTSHRWTLESVLVGGRDRIDLPLVIEAVDVGDVALVFSDVHTLLSGVLEGPEGRTSAGYSVVVFSSDRSLWLPPSRRAVLTRPRTDGHFEFQDLPPGDYLIAVVRDSQLADWRHSDVLESLAPGALSFTLAEGERRVLDLRLFPDAVNHVN